MVIAAALAAGTDHSIAEMEPAVDAQGVTSSIGPSAQNECVPGPSLPVRIATQSKYDQTFASKSVISQGAASLRKASLGPIEHQIRRLAAMSGAGDSVTFRAEPGCAAQMVTSWARAGSLTDMSTSDANLSRDRLMVDIAASIEALQARGVDLVRQPAIKDWLAGIGRQTIHYYDWQAGSTSRRNNHRYWAGLSVGMIGNLLQDDAMIGWSIDSFAVGACQIDSDGFLPLELARGSKALDYHLYAYRALASIRAVALSNRDSERLGCADRLERMRALMVRAMAGDPVFVERTGLAQDLPPRESAFLPAQRLSTLLSTDIAGF